MVVKVRCFHLQGCGCSNIVLPTVEWKCALCERFFCGAHLFPVSLPKDGLVVADCNKDAVCSACLEGISE